MEDLIDACHYGVDRTQCHVGCGRWCRPARRAQSIGNLLVAREYAKAAHPDCGTADCCGTCQTVSIPNTEETT